MFLSILGVKLLWGNLLNNRSVEYLYLICSGEYFKMVAAKIKN